MSSGGRWRMRFSVVTLVALLGVIGLVGVALGLAPGVARAAEVTGSPTITVSLTGPSSGTRLAPVTLDASVAVETDGSRTPAAGVTVTLERLDGSDWQGVATATTDAAGKAAITVTLGAAATQAYRAVVPASEVAGATASGASATLTVAASAQTGSLVLRMPRKVEDGHRIRLQVAWSAKRGPIAGGRVEVHRLQQGRAQVVRTLTLNAHGRAAFRTRPRWDSQWYLTGAAGSWYASARSATHLLNNQPVGRVVRLPKGAPKPATTLPEQPRVLSLHGGARPVITPVPDAIWAHMDGISWHAGCPVGRAQLSYLTITYWGFDGYPHRGQLVAASSVMPRFAAALAQMYQERLPIRAMYLSDYFGYSAQTHGADDFAAMRADDTSAFNCRLVDNAGNLSPHAYGTAIDVNTWENPYRSQGGLVPDAWWQSHHLRGVTIRSPKDPVARVMAAHGIRWTYGLGDTQHFDA